LFIQAVTKSCYSSRHQNFMREKFFKYEISEKISQKFKTNERLSKISLLSIERVRAEKTDMTLLMNFTVDMIIEGLSYIELISIMKVKR